MLRGRAATRRVPPMAGAPSRKTPRGSRGPRARSGIPGRWAGPRAGAAAPRRARPPSSRSSRTSARPSAAGSRGSPISSPSTPSSIWSASPPTALATTARPFHIASQTVSPNPSRRLFCTTTVARRWSALTIAAFSVGSTIGRLAICTRRRASCGSARHPAVSSASTAGPSGSSATPVTEGPASTRWAPAASAASIPANARITPMWSFSRSQRDTCTTRGTPGPGARPTRRMSAPRSTRAGEPSARRKTQTVPSGRPSTSPARTRIASAISSGSGWFFGEKGSIAGRMIATRPPRRADGT